MPRNGEGRWASCSATRLPVEADRINCGCSSSLGAACLAVLTNASVSSARSAKEQMQLGG